MAIVCVSSGCWLLTAITSEQADNAPAQWARKALVFLFGVVLTLLGVVLVAPW